MGVQTRSDLPDLLYDGLHSLFGSDYKKHPKEYTRIFDVRTSRKASERVVELTGLGLASVKAEGASIVYDKPGQGPRTDFTHVTYGLGYMLTREAQEDNLYQEVAEQNTRALTWSMLVTKEMVHANILNRATTAGYVGGDGVVLASASHPTVNGTQSNLLTAADLSEASLEDAMIEIMAVKNSRGLPIAIRPRRLIVGPGQIFNATRILTSDGRVGTADNDVNAIKALGMVPEIVYNHYLDDADAWGIQTDVPEGLLSFQRRALDLENDSDFDTENKKFKATERYSAGWGDWRAYFHNTGA
jgi:hypothetical protein